MKRLFSMILVFVMSVSLLASCAASAVDSGNGSEGGDGLLLPASATYSEDGVVKETITFVWGENECRFELKNDPESAPALGVEATYDPTENAVSYLVRNGVGSGHVDETGSSFTYADLELVTYFYDAEDKLISEMFEFGDYVSFTYGEGGKTFTITEDETVMQGTFDREGGQVTYSQEDGAEVSFFINEYGAILSTERNGDTASAPTYAYEYDANGNLIKITWQNEGVACELSFTLSELPLIHDWQRTVIDVVMAYRSEMMIHYALWNALTRALTK